MTPKDWTLLVLASAGGPLSPVQLQKTLFLIDRNLSRAQRGVTRFYNFRAYDYGPFDSAIYTDAVILQTEKSDGLPGAVIGAATIDFTT